jgi:uncharacterized metal-binding protein
MDNKKGLNFFFVTIAIISIRNVLEKFDFETLQFDFEIFKFDKPLASTIYIIYMLGFIASICGLIMNYKNLFKK